MDNERVRKLAERLKETREYLGVSQQCVAEYVGISRAAISAIESGKRKVEALELERFSKIYKFPIGYFYGEDQNDEQTVRLLARTAKDLTEVDRKQVLKFAQFLKNLGSDNTSK